MPAIDFSIPHNHEPQVVSDRIKSFMAMLRERNESKFLVKSEEWNNNTLNCSFSSFGFAMDAIMDVKPQELAFHLTIPFAALIFKGQIEERLRGEMSKILA